MACGQAVSRISSAVRRWMLDVSPSLRYGETSERLPRGSLRRRRVRRVPLPTSSLLLVTCYARLCLAKLPRASLARRRRFPGQSYAQPSADWTRCETRSFASSAALSPAHATFPDISCPQLFSLFCAAFLLCH